VRRLREESHRRSNSIQLAIEPFDAFLNFGPQRSYQLSLKCRFPRRISRFVAWCIREAERESDMLRKPMRKEGCKCTRLRISLRLGTNQP
jgi:hypothetical protein